MPRIEYDTVTEQIIMNIADSQKIQDDSPVKTRANVLSYLIGLHEQVADSRIMQIADRIGMKSDLFPKQTYKDAVAFLISNFEQSEHFKPQLEKLAEEEEKTQEKIAEYSKKSLDELKELGDKNVKGVAKGKVRKAIQDIMSANNKAKKQDDKALVTPSYVRKYLDTLNNSTRYANIKEVFEDMKTEIDGHNNRHGLDEKHNIRTAQARRRKRD